jgi:hypothetical protein
MGERYHRFQAGRIDFQFGARGAAAPMAFHLEISAPMRGGAARSKLLGCGIEATLIPAFRHWSARLQARSVGLASC